MLKNEPEKIPLDKEDSESYVDNTSLDDLFGPGSGTILQANSDDYNIPEEIKNVFEINGLSERSYRCILKQLESAASDKGSYITSWTKSVPTIEWIAKNYGPGEYMLVFSWRGRDPETGKMRNMVESCQISISEKFRDDYEDFQFQKRLDKAREKSSAIQRARLNKHLDVTISGAGESSPREGKSPDVKEYVKEIGEMAAIMGMTKKSSFDFEKIFAMAMPLLPAVIAYFKESRNSERQRQEEMMKLLLTVTTANTNNLLDIVKKQNGPSTGSDLIKEYKEMLFGALDLKTALKETTESSPVERIFELIEKIAPMLAAFLSMSQAKRESSPMFPIAKTYMENNPDLQTVINDPGQLAELVNRLDNHYGVEQTNNILQIAGIERPAGMQQSAEGIENE